MACEVEAPARDAGPPAGLHTGEVHGSALFRKQISGCVTFQGSVISGGGTFRMGTETAKKANCPKGQKTGQIVERAKWIRLNPSWGVRTLQ